MFYHADGAGNVTALMDAQGYIVARYLYDPFGRQLGQWGELAEANRYRFSSKEQHPQSGLYDYGFRFYDPGLQRWINEDPIGEEFDANLYRYVYNSPLNFIDPNGLWGIGFGTHNLGWGDTPTIQFGNPGWMDSNGVRHGGTPPSEQVPMNPDSFGALHGIDTDWMNGQQPGDFVAERAEEVLMKSLEAGMMLTPLGEEEGAYQAVDKLLKAKKAIQCERAATEMHHLLPQSKKLKPFFERAGLNVEDYKIPLDKAAHRLRPEGVHTGPATESWNGVWEQFFTSNPNANKNQILDQLGKMRKDFGI